MKKINKKGFTLIEILATVTIIGIVSAVAIGAYSKYQKKAKDNYYVKQEDLLTQAGRDYYNDNRGKLPQTTGQETCVLLDTLILNKYIPPIVDYNKNACNRKNSKVCARKLSNYRYLYYSTLDCGNGYKTPNYKAPSISMTPDKTNPAVNETVVVSMKVNYSSSSAGEESNLSSYRYQIFKKGSEERAYYDTEWKNIKGNKKELQLEIPLESDGTYYVVGMACNERGMCVDKKTPDITLRFNLDCNRDITFETTYTYGTWTKNDIKTKIKATGGVVNYDLKLVNNSDSSIAESINRLIPIYYNHTISREGIYHYEITAYDKNNTSCKINSNLYQIDKTAPICHVESSPTGWAKDKVILTATCTETVGSGCKTGETQATFTTMDSSPYKFTNITDKAGNVADCNSVAYKIDNTPPTINVNGYYIDKDYNYVDEDGNSVATKEEAGKYTFGSWSKYRVKLIADGKDSDSGLTENSKFFIKLGSATGSSDVELYQNKWRNCNKGILRSINVAAEGTSDVKFRNTDNAGNKTDSDYVNIKIDKTAPKITVTDTTDSSTGYITIKVAGDDKPSSTDVEGKDYSGIDKFETSLCQYYIYEGSATAGAGREEWINCAGGTNKDSYTIMAEGTSTMKFRIRDKAGNYKESEAKTYTKNTNAPTCTITATGTKGTNNWYKSNVSLTMTYSSNAAQYGLTTSTTTTYNSKTTATVTDDTGTDGITYHGYVKASTGQTSKCNLTVKKDAKDPVTTIAGYYIDKDYNYIDVNGNSVSDASKAGKYNIGTWSKYRIKMVVGGTDSNSGLTKNSEFFIELGSATGSSDVELYQNKWRTCNTDILRTINVAADGESNVKFRNTDNAGNQSETGYVNIKIDKTAPTATATASGTTVTVTGTDNQSGIRSNGYCLVASGGSCSWKTSNTFNVTVGEKYDYYVADKVGNISSKKSITVPNDIFKVALNKQGGTGGTTTIYEKYNNGWYQLSSSGSYNSISSVTLPKKTGHTFGGYYTNTDGNGTQVISSSGSILSGKTKTFSSNGTLYAKWTALTPSVSCSTPSTWSNSTNTIKITGTNTTVLLYAKYNESVYSSTTANPFNFTTNYHTNYVKGRNDSTDTADQTCYAYIDKKAPYTPYVDWSTMRINDKYTQHAWNVCYVMRDGKVTSASVSAEDEEYTGNYGCTLSNIGQSGWTGQTKIRFSFGSNDQPGTNESAKSGIYQYNLRGWCSANSSSTGQLAQYNHCQCDSSGLVFRKCEVTSQDYAGNISGKLTIFASANDMTCFNNGKCW